MNRIVGLNRNLISFGIPTMLLGVLVVLMQSSLLNGNNALSLAITADLLLTVPVVYFLLIRKTKIPKTTVVPVMIIGLLVGSYFLPKESQTYLNGFKNGVLPFIELFVLAWVILKVRKAIKTYQKLKQESPDFYDTLKKVCTEILPKPLVRPLATEVAVLYYGFMDWKERRPGSNEFTYHKKSGTRALLGGLIMVIAIETIALHLLLALWNPLVAWILTALSIYAGIQVLAFARALAKRPIAIEQNKLLLRYGIMNESQLPISSIESVVLTKKGLEKDKLSRTLSPLGELESYNVIIRLKEVDTLFGLYGMRKKFKTLGLHVDEPSEFKEKLEKAMNPTRCK